MNRLKSIVLAALAVVIAGAYALPAPTVSAQSSAALSIVPKKNYTVEPDKTIKDKLTIRNLDNEKPLELALRVVDFTYNGDGGTPKLMLDEDAPQTTWSLKPFLSVPKSVKIEPKGSKSLDMSLTVPKGHGAGSYYSAIVYESGASEGGNVGLSASGVTLVFAQIPGKVNQDLKLEKFGAYKLPDGDNQGKYQFLTMDEPKNIAYTLKNNGNVTESPVGNITLKGWFGNPISIDNVNPNGSLALIGQTRTYTACIKLKTEKVDFDGQRTQTSACDSPGLFPGYYSATLNLFYGQNGNRTQEILGNSGFWYLPWWFIVIVLVVLALVGFAAWKITRIVRGKLYGTNYRQPSRKKRR